MIHKEAQITFTCMVIYFVRVFYFLFFELWFVHFFLRLKFQPFLEKVATKGFFVFLQFRFEVHLWFNLLRFFFSHECASNTVAHLYSPLTFILWRLLKLFADCCLIFLKYSFYYTFHTTARPWLTHMMRPKFWKTV